MLQETSSAQTPTCVSHNAGCVMEIEIVLMGLMKLCLLDAVSYCCCCFVLNVLYLIIVSCWRFDEFLLLLILLKRQAKLLLHFIFVNKTLSIYFGTQSPPLCPKMGLGEKGRQRGRRIKTMSTKSLLMRHQSKLGPSDDFLMIWIRWFYL